MSWIDQEVLRRVDAELRRSKHAIQAALDTVNPTPSVAALLAIAIRQGRRIGLTDDSLHRAFHALMTAGPLGESLPIDTEGEPIVTDGKVH